MKGLKYVSLKLQFRQHHSFKLQDIGPVLCSSKSKVNEDIGGNVSEAVDRPLRSVDLTSHKHISKNLSRKRWQTFDIGALVLRFQL